MSMPLISPMPTSVIDEVSEPDHPWNLFLWNDPVTLMAVVVRALRRVFGYSEEKAEQLMLVAHLENKVVVFTGTREEAEAKCVQLHAAGLMATIAKDQ